MLIKADAKGLEWRVKAWLAQDKAAIEEILDTSRDVHSENQERFKLPSRTVAKNFSYRMIFADAFGEKGFEGPAFAYANDPNFIGTSSSVAYWAKVVERFFDKYSGMYNHSVEIIREACETGRVISPSGREYTYTPYTKWDGTPEWPRTQILNHIVQGFSADLMVLARKGIYDGWKWTWKNKALLNNTVHDDVEADVINNRELIYEVCCLMEDAFLDIPKLAKKWYNVGLNVPMMGEVKYGPTLYEGNKEQKIPSDMIEFKRLTFFKDYETNNN